MQQYTIYIPQQRNNGERLPAGYMATLVGRVLDLAGGCTVSAVQDGYWRSAGKLYCEPVVTVSCLASAQLEPAFRRLARQVAHELDQESVLLTLAHTDARFVTAAHLVVEQEQEQASA